MSSPLMLYPRSKVYTANSLPMLTSSGFSTHDQFWFLYPRSVLVSLPTISSGFSTHDQFWFLYPRSVPVSLPTISSGFSTHCNATSHDLVISWHGLAPCCVYIYKVASPSTYFRPQPEILLDSTKLFVY